MLQSIADPILRSAARQPGPARDRVWARKTNSSATEQKAFGNLTQFAATPELQYLTKWRAMVTGPGASARVR